MFAPNYHDIPLFKGLGREEINEVLHKFHGLIKHFPKSDYIYLAGDCIENFMRCHGRHCSDDQRGYLG